MNPASLLIFDDGRGAWGPMTDLRAVFDLRTGAATTLQRLGRVLRTQPGQSAPPAALWTTRAELANLLARQHDRPVNQPPAGQAVLCVNGRWTAVRDEELVRDLPQGAALVQPDASVAAAHLTAQQATIWLRAGMTEDQLPHAVKRIPVAQTMLIDRPWHILDQLEAALKSDLAATNLPRLGPEARGATIFGDHPVHVADDAVLQPRTVFNTEQGPIVIESGALIGALAVLEGPCHVGRGATVTCHAHIRPNTVIGPVCKAAGEISFSIIHSHSNKAHHGYLGHALIGQWVNLGAATNVSNLKNTYGLVRVQLEAGAQPQDTGRTFHGPIIGDFVRTAIATRLLTGACIGTGAMIAQSGFAPKYVPRFSFLTDAGHAPAQIDKFLATARAMMSRRHLDMPAELDERLRTLAT